MSKLGGFLSILARVGPMALAFTPLAPIAGPVVEAIAHAAALKGASNEEKRAHVKALAVVAADALNVKEGRVVLDPAVVESTADHAITTAYEAAKLIHDRHATDLPTG